MTFAALHGKTEDRRGNHPRMPYLELL